MMTDLEAWAAATWAKIEAELAEEEARVAVVVWCEHGYLRRDCEECGVGEEA